MELKVKSKGTQRCQQIFKIVMSPRLGLPTQRPRRLLSRVLLLFDAPDRGSLAVFPHGYRQHDRQMVAPAEPDLLLKNLPQPRGDAIIYTFQICDRLQSSCRGGGGNL